MEKIIGGILLVVVVALITTSLFFWSWNVFAVEVLNLKEISFYQAFAGVFLIGSTFGAAKAASSKTT